MISLIDLKRLIDQKVFEAINEGKNPSEMYFYHDPLGVAEVDEIELTERSFDERNYLQLNVGN